MGAATSFRCWVGPAVKTIERQHPYPAEQACPADTHVVLLGEDAKADGCGRVAIGG
jgi:hypothetical protein